MSRELPDKFSVNDDRVFIIAEISANHGHDFDKAVEMIKVAKNCGADAVKFQAYTPDTLTIDVNNEYFRIEHPQWGDQTLYELYKKAYTPWEWFPKLKKITDDLGITFLCSAFDKKSVDLLEELDVCAHKIASFELVDLGLIKYAAKTQKPLILSTGMANVGEIHDAVDTVFQTGNTNLILLKCVSSYPANPEEMNLATITHMRQLFGCPVGFSDHSLGTAAVVCAVAMGAKVVEKHFTLSRKHETPDSFFSIEPHELKELVENVRVAEKALGQIHYGQTEQENKSKIFRRSLFVVKDMKAGEVFTEDNVRSIRPGHGLPPKHLKSILAMSAKKEIKKGTPLSWGLVK